MKPESVQLCKCCLKLVSREDTPSNRSTRRNEHWSILGALRKSSLQCALCSIFLTTLERTEEWVTDGFHDIEDSYTIGTNIDAGGTLSTAPLSTYITMYLKPTTERHRPLFTSTFNIDSRDVDCKVLSGELNGVD